MKFTKFEVVAQYDPNKYTMESIRDFFIDKVLRSDFDITIEEIDTWEVDK